MYLRFLIEGGCIGREAEQIFATSLPQNVIEFCEEVFARGGAILHGPGGGRFVYDLRKQFDLFFKISPLQTANGVPQALRLKPDTAHGLDVLLTRENTGGIYQGRWDEEVAPSGADLMLSKIALNPGTRMPWGFSITLHRSDVQICHGGLQCRNL